MAYPNIHAAYPVELGIFWSGVKKHKKFDYFSVKKKRFLNTADALNSYAQRVDKHQFAWLSKQMNVLLRVHMTNSSKFNTVR